MNKKPGGRNPLRTAAEAELARALKPGENVASRPARELLHELQVHQIELEMQNEELRQAQLELGKSRDFYVDFYDFSSVGYLTLNHDGTIAEINLTGAALLGMERSRLLHRRFEYFVAVEDRDRWHLNFLSALKHDSKQSCELLLLRNDGSNIFAQLDYLKVKKAGEESAVRIVLSDITERRKLEEALKESELRYRTVANFTSDWEYWIMPDGTLRYVSPSCEEISGYTAEEFYADPQLLTRIVHPDDMQIFAGHAHHQSAHGVAEPIDFRIRSKGGEYRWLSHVCRVIYDSEGKSLGHRASNRDITARKQLEQALQHSETLFRELFENMRSAVVIYKAVDNGEDFIICDFNRSAELAEKVKREQVIGRRVTEAFPGVKQMGVFAVFQRVWETGKPEKFPTTFYQDERLAGWRENYVYRLPTGEVVAIYDDVTERKQMEEAVHAQEEFFRMIAENLEDFIAVLDLEGRRLYNSPSYTKIFGNIEAMKGSDSFAEIHPDDRERVKQAFRETVRSGLGKRLHFRFMLPDGRIRYMESSGGVIRNSDGQASRVLVVSQDITERKQAEENIHNMAFHDALTQLPNRRLLSDRLEHIMAASKRSGLYCALMFLDMDNFKPLNDEYGHEAGDLLLVEVARRISRCLREVDTVGRFGGDEFVVLLDQLDADKAESAKQAGIVAEKIRVILAEPYVIKIRREGEPEATIEHHSTSSIGVVLFINHENSAEDIVKWADLAMYQAKEAGRNLTRFYDAADSAEFKYPGERRAFNRGAAISHGRH